MLQVSASHFFVPDHSWVCDFLVKPRNLALPVSGATMSLGSICAVTLLYSKVTLRYPLHVSNLRVQKIQQLGIIVHLASCKPDRFGGPLQPSPKLAKPKVRSVRLLKELLRSKPPLC